MLTHIYRCASRYARRLPIGPVAAGMSDVFFPSPNISYTDTASAVPLIASRVSLPSSVGTADLMKLLPPDVATVYSSPSLMLRPPEEVAKAPRVMVCASHEEYLALIRRMVDLGMVEFTTAPKVVNGVFGVPKDGNSIRLIIDARPANAVFVEPPKVQLPTPDLLSQLVVPEGTPFFVAKVDIDNFYHRLTLPSWMRPYFALPPLSSSELGLPGSKRPVYPCCTKTTSIEQNNKTTKQQNTTKYRKTTKPTSILTPNAPTYLSMPHRALACGAEMADHEPVYLL